jgi:hypothetical protein
MVFAMFSGAANLGVIWAEALKEYQKELMARLTA